jgi:hypothetical protein
VFLNDNLWLALAFAVAFLSGVVGLLFFLAWMEPRDVQRPATSRPPQRGRPVPSRR